MEKVFELEFRASGVVQRLGFHSLLRLWGVGDGCRLTVVRGVGCRGQALLRLGFGGFFRFIPWGAYLSRA